LHIKNIKKEKPFIKRRKFLQNPITQLNENLKYMTSLDVIWKITIIFLQFMIKTPGVSTMFTFKFYQ